MTDTIPALLSSAEAIARQTGDDELASKILNLRLFGTGDQHTDIPLGLASEPADESPPFDPPYVMPFRVNDPEMYRLPSGSYAGCRVRDLTTQQLQRVWAGYNGAVGCSDIADKLKAALRGRMVAEVRRNP